MARILAHSTAFLIIIILIHTLSFAQYFSREINAIPIFINEISIHCPFIGGFKMANPTFVDIDGDNDFDLFIGEENGNINFFKNGGTNTDPLFCLMTEFYENINTDNSNFPCFIDIDADEDFDLFIGRNDGCLTYYRNIGTSSSPAWIHVTDNFASIDVESDSKPAFTDIDGDGDYDLFIGETDGNINYYENIGTPTIASFTFRTDNFADTDIGLVSSPLFVDMDNDHDFDLLVGTNDGQIHYFKNNGTITTPLFNESVLEGLTLIDYGWNVVPAATDFDNDGDFDVVIGEADGNINFFRNQGGGNFLLENETLVPFDFGYRGQLSAPSLVDIDGDNDLDLFITKLDVEDSHINYYQNTGTRSNPVFKNITERFESITITNPVVTTFVDINNDGDYDLVVGNSGSRVRLYRNNGTPVLPDFNPTTFETLVSIIGYGIAPFFADIDNDGDFDLFIGEEAGNVNFCRNTGTANNPTFVLESENFASIDIGESSKPSFTDIDEDGDLDLYIGEKDGNINFYQNNGTPENCNFVLIDAFFAAIDVGRYSAPAFADINSDGDDDLFIGESDGGLVFYRFETKASFEYSAFITCSSIIKDFNKKLPATSYSTIIGIHNPNDFDVEFRKKVALTLPPGKQKPGQISQWVVDIIKPDESLEVSCSEILDMSSQPVFPSHNIRGFLVILCTSSLDVQAIYTSTIFDKNEQTLSTSIDVERIHERK